MGWLTAQQWDALGSVVGALGALGAFAVALVLLRKQSKALTTTTEALSDEMKHRRKAEERQREAQARAVYLDTAREVTARETEATERFLARSGLRPDAFAVIATVFNRSQARITNVDCRIAGARPRCYVLEKDTEAREGVIPVLPPGASVRLFWTGKLTELELGVEFIDEAGVRWWLHHRNGLVELPGGSASNADAKPSPPSSRKGWIRRFRGGK